MNKAALVFVMVLTLLGGMGVGSAQDRDARIANTPQRERMLRGDGSHKVDGDREHRHHRAVVVVGVPVFVGPYGQYGLYDAAPPEAYRTLEGFYYYCYEPSGYYPAVPDCPSGWRLVP